METIDEIQNEIKNVEHLLRHIELVQQNCLLLGKHLIEDGKSELGRLLIKNSLGHDSSKLVGSEWDFIKLTGYKRLNKGQRVGLAWAIKQHTSNNQHHPEFWSGIKNMPEVCVIEMVGDWKARATEFGTNLREWIDDEATKRYDFKSSDSVYIMIMKYVNILCGEPFAAVDKS